MWTAESKMVLFGGTRSRQYFGRPPSTETKPKLVCTKRMNKTHKAVQYFTFLMSAYYKDTAKVKKKKLHTYSTTL